MTALTTKEKIALERLIRDYECNCYENTIEVKILKRLLARSGKQPIVNWKFNIF
jgi:ribosomal protein L18E